MSAEVDETLAARVRAYAQDDPDPQARAELLSLLSRGAAAELQERFAQPLQFGTAGLRGPLGAGPARINRATVAQATAALCAELLDTVPDAAERGLCIGFDARHQSRELASEAAEVAAGAGFRVHLFGEPIITPLLAFSLLDEGAAAGAMITASHNPAPDNGFKVYWSNGVQIIPPVDHAIAQRMREIASLRALPRTRDRIRALGTECEQRYLQGVSALAGQVASGSSRLRIAYTALHGVGERYARAALATAGFREVSSVAAQAEPHPDFPTVAFPNPEEPGAIDLLLALARDSDAALALANDPDADRLAVVARDRDGALRTLSGNETGMLLADYLLSRGDGAGHGERFVLSSIVSSPMLGSIAAAHEARWESTLTGFKWICNRALELESAGGARFVFGYEEALGYCAGRLVRDKDGISAAVLIALLADRLARAGSDLCQQLDLLARRHGLWLSSQLSVRYRAPDRAAEQMRALRARAPRQIAGRAIAAQADIASGATVGHPRLSHPLPPSDLLIWELAAGHRILVRPSGTEPKLKLYLDVHDRIAPGESIERARNRAQATLHELEQGARELLSPEG